MKLKKKLFVDARCDNSYPNHQKIIFEKKYGLRSSVSSLSKYHIAAFRIGSLIILDDKHHPLVISIIF